MWDFQRLCGGNSWSCDPALARALPASLLPSSSSSRRPQERAPSRELGWLGCGISRKAEREPREGRKSSVYNSSWPRDSPLSRSWFMCIFALTKAPQKGKGKGRARFPRPGRNSSCGLAGEGSGCLQAWGRVGEAARGMAFSLGSRKY